MYKLIKSPDATYRFDTRMLACVDAGDIFKPVKSNRTVFFIRKEDKECFVSEKEIKSRPDLWEKV